jgi:Uma2 family endonuclease
MSEPTRPNGAGLSERGQEPYADIPTDPDAFMHWAAGLTGDDGYKYELSRGKVIRMMNQISRGHWRVTANVLAELLKSLQGSCFEVGPSEFGVKTGVGVRYPDVVVDQRNDRLKDLACEAPILIVEVLSPSTAVLDVTTKQREYTAIPSLKTYLVCSQDEPRTWVWAREADGSFPIDADEFVGRDGTIPLGGLDIELSMAAIFRGIPDAPTL